MSSRDERFFTVNAPISPHDRSTSPVDGRRLALCSTQEARALLDYLRAQQMTALPLGVSSAQGVDLLSVAVVAGAGAETRSALEFATGRKVRLFELPEAMVRDAIHRAYRGDHAQMRGACDLLARVEVKPGPESGAIQFRGSEADVPRFLESLVDFAIAHDASDIHLQPCEQGAYVRLRIDGKLYPHEEPICSLPVFAHLIARIKVLAALDTTQHQRPLDGSFSFRAAGRPVHIRVSTLPTVNGEKVVLRILGVRAHTSLEALGMPAPFIEAIEGVARQRCGAILVGGSVASGKSSTLYGIIERLLQWQFNVATVEDPVECRIRGVSQTAVNAAAGLTFATALRAMLRQDPDAMMIGEIRDAESAEVALQSASTGHLVLSTLHVGSAHDVTERLTGLGVDSTLIDRSVRLVLWQKLVPTLCPRCRVIDLAATRTLGFTVQQPVGCQRCEYSGFSQRALIVEGLLRVREVGEGSHWRPIHHHTIAEQLMALLRGGLLAAAHCEQELRAIRGRG